MTRDRMATFTAYSFYAAGVFIALWRIAHPWGTLAGADVARSGGWLVAHSAHFLAGTFLCAGLPLLLVTQRERFRDALSMTSIIIAFIGSALFAGTGVLTAYFWPTLALHAPEMVAADGPFFTSTPTLTVITSLLLSAGFIFLAFALRRQAVLSDWRSALVVVGFIMLLLPPTPLGPTPWMVFAFAGLVAGAGLVAFGSAVWHAGTGVGHSERSEESV